MQAEPLHAELLHAEPLHAEPAEAETLKPEIDKPSRSGIILPCSSGIWSRIDLTFDETEPAAPRLRIEAFAEIDRMPTREKLRAFT